MEEHLPEKWLTTWGAQIVLGGGNILLAKLKCPARKNLEIMTFRYLKTLVFDKIFKKLRYLLLYFWRVLLVMTNPLLYDYLTLSPDIHSSPHLFQENWHDHKKVWRFQQRGGAFVQWGIILLLPCTLFCIKVHNFEI